MLAGMEHPLLVEILAILCPMMEIAPTLVGEHAVIRAATLQHNRVGKCIIPLNSPSFSQ